MSNRLILCVAGSGVSKDALALCLDGIEDAQIEYADTLSALRKRMRDVSPAVIIAPWSDAGVTLLGTRSTMHSFDPSSSLPALLALTQSITPAKIALAKSAAALAQTRTKNSIRITINFMCSRCSFYASRRSLLKDAAIVYPS